MHTRIFIAKIHKCALIFFRDIKVARYIFDEWINVEIYMREENANEKDVLFLIKKEIYIVDNLKTKFLMSMNIINSKKIIINILEKYIHFKATSVSIFYETKTKNAIKIRRIIKIMKRNFFFKNYRNYFHNDKKISNKFFFEIISKKAYAHVINANFNFVNIRNDENISLTILSRKKLDVIIKCENFEIYSMIEKNLSLVLISKKNLTKHSFFQKLNS